MPGGHYITFKNLRPPICIDGNGGSPLRGRVAKSNFALGDGNYQDRSGFKITKEFVVQQMTDDGRFVDQKWNPRHFEHPTKFNDKNTSYYKVNPPSFSNLNVRNTSINRSKSSRTLHILQTRPQTLILTMRRREHGCPTTLALQRTETCLVNWAGFQTLTLKSQKTTKTVI